MKTTAAILGIALILNTPGAMAQGRSNDNELQLSEIKDIFQLALDLPELQLYMHTGADPDRNQLYIQEFGLVNQDNMKGVAKNNRQVKVMREMDIKRIKTKNYMIVGDMTHVGNSLRLQIIYPVEGVKVTYQFRKANGQWSIFDYTLIEE